MIIVATSFAIFLTLLCGLLSSAAWQMFSYRQDPPALAYWVCWAVVLWFGSAAIVAWVWAIGLQNAMTLIK